MSKLDYERPKYQWERVHPDSLDDEVAIKFPSKTLPKTSSSNLKTSHTKIPEPEDTRLLSYFLKERRTKATKLDRFKSNGFFVEITLLAPTAASNSQFKGLNYSQRLSSSMIGCFDANRHDYIKWIDAEQVANEEGVGFKAKFFTYQSVAHNVFSSSNILGYLEETVIFFVTGDYNVIIPTIDNGWLNVTAQQLQAWVNVHMRKPGKDQIKKNTWHQAYQVQQKKLKRDKRQDN
jgi:hypothetical protein